MGNIAGLVSLMRPLAVARQICMELLKTLKIGRKSGQNCPRRA
jgi:hypothetical protein